MILTYHNIDFISKDENTVCLLFFIVHLLILKIKHKRIVFLDEYNPDDKTQVVLRFDDGYLNIYKYVAPILKLFNFKFEIFISPCFIGKILYMDLDMLKKIQHFNCRIQYHALNHKNLSLIEDEELLDEEIRPSEFFKDNFSDLNFNYIAYPYWKYNDKAVKIAQKYYKGALSGNGFSNNTQYALNSIKVLNTINIGENNE